MSLESIADRRRKRIVEQVILYFNSAAEATRFGSTASMLVNDRLDTNIKFRQCVGAGDTTMAITENYDGPVALKMTFLEVPGNEAANAIRNVVQHYLKSHNAVHHTSVKIADEVVREKPQAQTLGFQGGVRRAAAKPLQLKLVR